MDTPTETPPPTNIPPSSPTPDFNRTDTDALSLRVYAGKRDFHVGAAVAYEPLMAEPSYAETLAREFNLLTAENVMKFSIIHPTPDTYDFSRGDALVAFAQENNMMVRGHTLVWHNQLPEWLTSTDWSRDELLDILRDHITTLVTHYKGQISAWDVINEGIDDNGNMRHTIWYDTIGPEYIDLAFQWAHEADPDAQLFYNDYGAEGFGRKSMAVYALVKDLKERGIPIHGVGLQLHAELHTSPSIEGIRENISQLAGLGFAVHITEMDIRIRDYPEEDDLLKQARIYHDIAQLCLNEEACQALIFWGFTDKYSWIPGFSKGFGSALPFDAEYQPKPAYHALVAALAQD